MLLLRNDVSKQKQQGNTGLEFAGRGLKVRVTWGKPLIHACAYNEYTN